MKKVRVILRDLDILQGSSPFSAADLELILEQPNTSRLGLMMTSSGSWWLWRSQDNCVSESLLSGWCPQPSPRVTACLTWRRRSGLGSEGCSDLPVSASQDYSLVLDTVRREELLEKTVQFLTLPRQRGPEFAWWCLPSEVVRQQQLVVVRFDGVEELSALGRCWLLLVYASPFPPCSLPRHRRRWRSCAVGLLIGRIHEACNLGPL